ncbi:MULTISPECIES: hypothetical protein [unclassified Arthrobacter]|uniref:hypothetical protein n=1 Tax=unclassified Arthrobacter TaxID=235627 RepID=UPI001E432D0D|nr:MULTISPECIES: hypothetical protein [unclassified Arthrobacter]MCC9144767.1 hypothetical protein [Arthrobacter sp. zg-Y919]MDK1275993.1 hypothetical protein [Arthrobacter sp. zg.Y919]WIB02659.1 hypothetical protein QNO10_11980 [Arthrobacter sp. zg-Y919]
MKNNAGIRTVDKRVRVAGAVVGGTAAGALLGWAASATSGASPLVSAAVFAAATGPVLAAALWLLVFNVAETDRVEVESAADVERSWSDAASSRAFVDLMVLLAVGVLAETLLNLDVPLPVYCAAGLAAWSLRYALLKRRNS